MPIASVLLRTSASYGRPFFAEGLTRAGYTVSDRYKRRPDPDDLLLIWNRTRGNEPLCQIYERAGARVLIAENGYLRPPGEPKMYALAIGHHNGAGTWRIGSRCRHKFAVRDWRNAGDHILVLPQRGIGEKGVAMPLNWPIRIQQRLKLVTDRPIKVRRHPGAEKSDPWPDLQGAWAAVTWGSGAGIKALAYGIPVFHDFERWIGAPAARGDIRDIEDPWLGDRRQMLRRLSWAQWTQAEIGSGEAFRWLLGR